MSLKKIIANTIDLTIKRRIYGSYIVYIAAKRVVSAYENHDVDMRTNGEAWLVSRIVARGEVVAIDVGANQGEWVSQLVKAVPGARVFCYEPVPSTFARLEVNIPSNRQVVLLNKGLSSEDADLTINSVLDNPYISTIYDVKFYEEGHATQPISMRMSTGDSEIEKYGLKNINIVKVDVEGHDYDVLLGFGRAIGAGIVDMFQFEYNQFTLAARRALRDFFELFNGRYVICRLLPNGLEACGYHPDIENFKQTNWVAIRREMINSETIRQFCIKPAKGLPGLALAKSLRNDPELARFFPDCLG